MRTLILEDDFTSQLLLYKLLKPYGECDVAHDGLEAVEAFRLARSLDQPYDLICLDIMVPEMDGQEVLQKIRALERERGVIDGRGAKIIMTTALKDSENVMQAFHKSCDAYLAKPIDKAKLLQNLRELGLIE